jgi:thermolabile hemolysin
MMIHRTLIVVSIVCCACAETSHARAFSQMVVFGDSLSDVGNVNNQTFGISPGSGYWNGRFSNGPVWVESLATGLSLSVPTYSRGGGTDWAYGGAHTGPGSITHVFFTFPNVQTQINNYLNANNPNANQLFVVWAGGNDFIDGGTDPSVPVTNTANEITSLANRGATNIVVPNLPLLGEVPRYRGTASEASKNSLSSQFNAQLATTLANLKSSLHINIYPLNVQAFFSDVLANPSAYGFTNATSPAFNGSTSVSNPDQYVFWDDIHPTRIAHQLLAQRAVDLVNTHNWIASGSAAWATTGNWDPSGAPAAAWIVNLANATAQDKTCAVSSSATVNRITVTGNGSPNMNLLLQPGANLNAAGSIQINTGGVVELAGGSLGAASINVNAGGTIRLDLTSSDVGGAAKINVSGQANLSGTLAVATLGGFVPLPDQPFGVMRSGSRSGDLSILNQTGFAGLRFNKNYSATALNLTAWALGGDANLDASVDTTDFNILAANFGSAGQNWLRADFNGDTIIDTLDFNVLASNFAQTTPPQMGAALVPEPSVLAMGIFTVALLRRRCAPREAGRGNRHDYAQ